MGDAGPEKKSLPELLTEAATTSKNKTCPQLKLGEAPSAEGAGEFPRLSLCRAFLQNLQQFLLTHPVVLNLHEIPSGYL